MAKEYKKTTILTFRAIKLSDLNRTKNENQCQASTRRDEKRVFSSQELTRALNYQIKINKSDYRKEIWNGATVQRWPYMTHFTSEVLHWIHSIDRFDFNSFYFCSNAPQNKNYTVTSKQYSHHNVAADVFAHSSDHISR